jgi:hypothetical protein
MKLPATRRRESEEPMCTAFKDTSHAGGDNCMYTPWAWARYLAILTAEQDGNEVCILGGYEPATTKEEMGKTDVGDC